MNLAKLLNLLPAVGPIIAAAPEFKALFDDVVALLATHDQATAKQAYDLAISKARNSHQQLQDLVARHSD